MQTPKIITIPPKRLVGMHITHSFANHQAGTLWRRFMPRRHEVANVVGAEHYSVQVLSKGQLMKDLRPEISFTTWAAVEVSAYEDIPEGMEPFTLKGGDYAVFIYKGVAETFRGMFQYIYLEWLPSSPYREDERAHFEVLGEKYLGPTNPESEEEIWVPIRKR